MKTNEMQNEVGTRDEMRGLTIDELDTVGGGRTGIVNALGANQ
jgi:hypothetical protein